MNQKALIGVGVMAGVAQAVAGAAMYLAGVYFAPWSMGVTLVLLMVCIGVGTRWYSSISERRDHLLAGTQGGNRNQCLHGPSVRSLQYGFDFMVLSTFPGRSSASSHGPNGG